MDSPIPEAIMMDCVCQSSETLTTSSLFYSSNSGRYRGSWTKSGMGEDREQREEREATIYTPLPPI